MKTIRIMVPFGEPIPVTGTLIRWEGLDSLGGLQSLTIQVADDCPLPDGAVEVDTPSVETVEVGPAHWLETSDLASVCREAWIAEYGFDSVGDSPLRHVGFAPCWEAAALAVARRVKEEA